MLLSAGLSLVSFYKRKKFTSITLKSIPHIFNFFELIFVSKRQKEAWIIILFTNLGKEYKENIFTEVCTDQQCIHSTKSAVKKY